MTLGASVPRLPREQDRVPTVPPPWPACMGDRGGMNPWCLPQGQLSAQIGHQPRPGAVWVQAPWRWSRRVLAILSLQPVTVVPM